MVSLHKEPQLKISFSHLSFQNYSNHPFHNHAFIQSHTEICLHLYRSTHGGHRKLVAVRLADQNLRPFLTPFDYTVSNKWLCKKTIKTCHNAGSIFSDGLFESRPAQLAELFRRAFDPDLFSHSAYVKFLCDIRNKSAVFNILLQNETIFDVGNG